MGSTAGYSATRAKVRHLVVERKWVISQSRGTPLITDLEAGECPNAATEKELPEWNLKI